MTATNNVLAWSAYCLSHGGYEIRRMRHDSAEWWALYALNRLGPRTVSELCDVFDLDDHRDSERLRNAVNRLVAKDLVRVVGRQQTRTRPTPVTRNVFAVNGSI